MTTSELWQWSAGELAQAIQRKDISAREAVDSAFDRLDAVNGRVNAVVDVLYAEARSEADRADQVLADGGVLGPLHGVPITVKIDTDYRGRPTTTGVSAYQHQLASDDAPVIANLRRAGAIIIGRTNVPAFTSRYFTDNDLHGRTYNPWDRDTTPGGSSGGAAVAVACGVGALAHGTDRSGSVRYPAYANGVLGLRPGLGRLPNHGLSPYAPTGLLSQLSNTSGLLARRPTDLSLCLAAMSGIAPHDPWQVAGVQHTMSNAKRIGVVLPDSGVGDVDRQIRDALARTAEAFARAGYGVDTVSLPHLDEAAVLFRRLLATEDTLERGASIESHGDAAVRRTRRNARGLLPAMTLDDYVGGLSRRGAILHDWLTVLDAQPLLLMPLSLRNAFPIDEDQHDATRMQSLLRAQHPLVAVSLTGLPALALPVRAVDASEGSVPAGVQLVARRFGEERLIEAAEAVWDAVGVHTPIEPV